MNTAPKKSSLKGIIILNMGLLVLLAIITFSANTATAQSRGRGDYAMVAGGAKGTDSSVVYIVDQANQELMAVTYNQTSKQLEGLTYKNLANDAKTMTRPHAGGN